MTGELRIKVTPKDIAISGVLKEDSLIERVAIVDALMNAFGMKGEERKLVCRCLLSADEAKTKATDEEIIGLMEKLFEALKEK